MSAERVLVDTNIFVYATDTASPHCPAASAFLGAVGSGSFIGCVTPQVLLEFVSVVTNPKRVVAVRTAEEGWAAADAFAASLTMIVPPETSVFSRVPGMVARTPTLEPAAPAGGTG